MSEKNLLGKKIALLSISAMILLILISPISANELDDSIIVSQDNSLCENTLQISTMEPDSINEEMENEPAIDNDLKAYDSIEDSTLEETEQEAGQSSHSISDDNYNQYFNSNGNINENTIKSGDTLILGQLTNKAIKITIPLNLIGSDDNLISNGQITIEKGGSNTNITGIKIINTDANKYGIYLKNTENVTIKDCYLKTKHFAIPIIYSNYTNIINNTIDNDLTTGHTAIPLGSSHNNNISYNNIKNGANCIYLCQYNFADFNEYNVDCNNNTISFNTIYGETTAICYGISVYGKNNTIINNSVEHTGLGIITYQEGNKIYFNNCTNNNKGLEILGSDFTLNNTVDGVLINGNQYHEEVDTTEKETVYVDGEKGSDSNDGTAENPFKTIKAAVNYINSQEKGLYGIIVAEGTYNENNIVVDNHLNLIGNGTVTINGESKNNILIINEYKSVYIESISFINGKGKTENNGGAIHSLGNLTIENCTFKNNKAIIGDGWGGAIYSQYITVNNCTFIGNMATDGILYNLYDFKINNTNFISNKASNGEILASGMKSMASGFYMPYNGINNPSTISNCNFEKNTASPVLICMNPFNVTNSTFKNNAGTSVEGCFNLDSCHFENNSAKEWGTAYISGVNLTIRNCEFINNKADSGGAIIIETDSNISILNSTFINNSARVSDNYGESGGSGGAILCLSEGSSSYQSSTLKIKDCEFRDNSGREGGAICSYGKLIVENSSFVNNSASQLGGAIYAPNSNIKNGTFINNSAKLGGGIATKKGSVNQSIFLGNRAEEGNDIFIMDYAEASGQYAFMVVGDYTLNNNYWDNASSKEDFINGKKIVQGELYLDYNYDTQKWEYRIRNMEYISPAFWITLDDDEGEGGIGDGEGTGIGNGTGNGTDDNTENENGNSGDSGIGDGTGEGIGNGTGNGIGDGNGTGIGNGNGTGFGNGNGTGNIISDIISNNANGNISHDGNNPKTDMKTDAGTYSTNPSKSDASPQNSGGSSSSPGDSGGKLKSYELEKKVKIDIKDNIYLYLILLIIFASLLFFGFYRRKRDDEEEK